MKAPTHALRLAGGLFLSSKTLSSFRGKVVFVDASRELESTVAKTGVEKMVVISTRTFEAIEVTQHNLNLLRPFLQKCESQQKTLEQRLQRLRTRLGQYKFPSKNFLFYLGKLSEDNLPPLLIVQDGAVKALIDRGLRSYPSTLAYANWSEKTVRTLEGIVEHLGLEEGENDGLSVTSVGKHRTNLAMRGILTPGISQVRFLEAFLDSTILR